mgnify:FL=1
MEHSRVYVDVLDEDGKAIFTIKNVSESSLNISPDELTERFVREMCPGPRREAVWDYPYPRI